METEENNLELQGNDENPTAENNATEQDTKPGWIPNLLLWLFLPTLKH